MILSGSPKRWASAPRGKKVARGFCNHLPVVPRAHKCHINKLTGWGPTSDTETDHTKEVQAVVESCSPTQAVWAITVKANATRYPTMIVCNVFVY